jgi:hypothetical protein
VGVQAAASQGDDHLDGGAGGISALLSQPGGVALWSAISAKLTPGACRGSCTTWPPGFSACSMTLSGVVDVQVDLGLGAG